MKQEYIYEAYAFNGFFFSIIGTKKFDTKQLMEESILLDKKLGLKTYILKG